MFSPAEPLSEAAIDLLASARGQRFWAILADPPWQFQNRTGKVTPLLHLDQPLARFKSLE